MSIQPITPLTQVATAYATSQLRPARNSSDFADMVGNAASAAIQTVHEAEHVTALGVAGKADVQDVVQSMSNAEVTMQAVVAVRDKVLSAYNDVMRMSV
ncbi:MAG TPA: flagellar hook-basal body complex protein FliE [Acetobacteraceae bacterium]|nr:flagellar hook-basal body complex protein FliE [Acetobacteraceae bacterium]